MFGFPGQPDGREEMVPKIQEKEGGSRRSKRETLATCWLKSEKFRSLQNLEGEAM